MAATLKLEIVTPEKTAYSEDVEMVTLPGSEGELGVYPNHVPLLTTLNPGELRVLKGGKETCAARLINKNKLESAVLAKIKEQILSPTNIRSYILAFNDLQARLQRWENAPSNPASFPSNMPLNE